MKRTNIWFHICIAITLLALFVPRDAKGDGGVIRLRETQGPFSVTVFSSPDAAAGGLADVSVLVQGRETGNPLLDADVSLTLSPPDGMARKQSEEFCSLPTAAMSLPNGINNPASVRATREQASNKLLYAAQLELRAAGNWWLHVNVSHGSDNATFDCFLPVSATSVKLSGLWPYLAFPPIAIVAFAMNQRLRRHSLEIGRPDDPISGNPAATGPKD
jgi:hypothetical protein